jgi:predicted transglutaminase-like protease
MTKIILIIYFFLSKQFYSVISKNFVVLVVVGVAAIAVIMLTIQDQVIPPKNYRKFIIKEALVDNRYRRCGKSTLTTIDYTQRHDKVVHQQLAKDMKLLTSDDPYYRY